MKEAELRLYAECSICHKLIGHTGLPLFWRVTVERFGIKADPVRRQTGLAMAMGSAELAQVMGPDEEMTMPLLEKITLSICELCGTADTMVARLVELRDVLA
jgi:hypothetical protein